MADLIMVCRKWWNSHSLQVEDVVEIEPSENQEEVLAVVASEHLENIYFFANLDTDV